MFHEPFIPHTAHTSSNNVAMIHDPVNPNTAHTLTNVAAIFMSLSSNILPVLQQLSGDVF
jgi:hypothetical protein